MKLILFLLMISAPIWGAPVLNNNMAAEGTLITIWPDHEDANHFYFAPNSMKIAASENGKPKFHLTRYQDNCRFGRCDKKAFVSALFETSYQLEQLKAAQAGILKLRPGARFSVIPFQGSRVEFGKTMSPFIVEHDCSPKAGQAADEVPCTMNFNPKGVNTLVDYLGQGKVLPFKFFYKLSGVIQEAEGKFRNEALDFGITVNFGGEILIGHEDLVD